MGCQRPAYVPAGPEGFQRYFNPSGCPHVSAPVIIPRTVFLQKTSSRWGISSVPSLRLIHSDLGYLPRINPPRLAPPVPLCWNLTEGNIPKLWNLFSTVLNACASVLVAPSSKGGGRLRGEKAIATPHGRGRTCTEEQKRPTSEDTY